MNRGLAGYVVWTLTERLRGRDTIARLRVLNASQREGPGGLRAIQTVKLRRLLTVAARHCPFHRERLARAGIDPADPGLDPEVLRHLPPMTRGDVRDHLADMTWSGVPGGLRPYNTGGSTGEPLAFYIDAARQSADWAARWRARAWWGLKPGCREVLLWGTPARPGFTDRLRVLRDRLLNQRVLNAFDLSDRAMDVYIRQLQRRRPECIYGYASSLALLGRHALRRGLPPGSLGSVSLRAVFVTGEVLTESDRLDIAEAFGAPVVVEYGSRDAGFIASGCPRGGLHIAQENVIVEVLDAEGRPVPPGDSGEVTVTCLESFATPLIRYRLGDIARITVPAGESRSCPCGLALERLEEIQGRVTDLIVCRRGGETRRMHALSLIYVLREAPGVRRFRILQQAPDDLVVEVEADEAFTPQVRDIVVRRLRERLGPQTRVTVRSRDRIPPSASGKHAQVVSRLAPEEALR